MKKKKKRKTIKRKKTKKEYKRKSTKKRTYSRKYLNNLLKRLEQKIDYLSNKFNISGYTKEDLKQELVLKVLEDVRDNIGIGRQDGWWFQRLQWHLHNLLKKEERNPLNKAKSLSTYRL